MLDIGPEKLLIIFGAVLVFLGPKELPAAVRTLRKWRGQLRSFQETIRTEVGSMFELPRADEPPTSPSPDDRPPTPDGVA